MALHIGVVTDTHIRAGGRSLPAALIAGLKGVDALLHAGDIACREVLELLATIAPIHAVYGNVDPPDLRRDLPDRRLLLFEGVRIGLTHGHLGRGSTTPRRAVDHFLDTANLDMIVFGHSHVPLHESRSGLLLFNPGSPTQRRRQPLPSYGVIQVDGHRVSASIITFDP